MAGRKVGSVASNSNASWVIELDNLRTAGWSVAVHNDYKLNGVAMTFWLFTHPNGRWCKGEGKTDSEAIEEVLGRVGITVEGQT
jgi:hypothetical protein